MKDFKKLSMCDENEETTASNSTTPLLDLDNVVVPKGTLCDCEDKAVKHFIKNWCEDCKKHIV